MCVGLYKKPQPGNVLCVQPA